MIEIKFKNLEKQRYDEMFDWCREQFGREALWVTQLDIPDGPSGWYSTSSYPKSMFGTIDDLGNARFNFRDDRDATMFSLRWSESKK